MREGEEGQLVSCTTCSGIPDCLFFLLFVPQLNSFACDGKNKDVASSCLGCENGYLTDKSLVFGIFFKNKS